MTKIVIPTESETYAELLGVTQSCDIAFVVGMPGVGKSLFVQQLALMAQQTGRAVHLLQWDVTRTAFEIDDILARYPDLVNGETHPFIRKAVGAWARQGVLDWYQEYGESDHILIGEAPLYGSRLADLSRPTRDKAEPVLSGARSRFILPVPSSKVRRTIEARRAETSSAPQHERESFDAPPNLLQEAWQEIDAIGRERGLVTELIEPSTYDPDVYQAVFEHLLQHRTTTVAHIDEVLHLEGSVYDLEAIESELSATPAQVRETIVYLEANFTPEEIAASVERWHRSD